jgi:uncharacterized protein (DUF58 family)
MPPRGLYSKYYDPAKLARFGNLQLLARSVVEGYISGLHRSPYKGFSAEFAEYREYMPGDDLKRFDWKVFARSDRRYVREYEEETNMTCTLLLDASGSMGYHSEGMPRKFDYACCMAAALVYLMTQQRDQVGLAVFDNVIRERIPARSSPAHMKYIIDRLETHQPRDRSGIAPALHSIAESLKRRGLVIVLSDLMDDPTETLRAFQHFRHERHELIVFNIFDPAEIEFPFGGLIEFRDLETRERLDARAEVLRDAYLEAFNAFTERLRRETTNAKIDYQLVNTKTPFEHMLAAYLKRREKMGK